MAERPRIVSLIPAATDMLRAMGAQGQLVGASHLCAVPPSVPRVLSTPIDSEAWDMNRIGQEVRRRLDAGEPLYVPDEERIAALKPDIILTQGLCPVCAAGPKTIEGIGSLSPPRVVTLTPHSLEDVARDIEAVGEAAGCSEAGSKLAAGFRSRIGELRKKHSQRTPRPRVTVVEWFAPLWISGEWIIEMVEVAGGESVPLKSGEGSRPATWGEIESGQPDVIVLAACSMSIERAARELHHLEQQPEWGRLRAVSEGRVALMDGEAHFSAPGPNLIEGIERLAEVLDVLGRNSRPPAARGPGYRVLS